MPKHRVTVTLPSHELTGVDLKLDVVADGKKLGELLVSRGGLTWKPRGRKTNMVGASWEQFADWMES